MNRNEIVGLTVLVVLIAVGIGIQEYRTGRRESGVWVQVLPEPASATPTALAALAQPALAPSPSPTPANVLSTHPAPHTAIQVDPPQKVTPLQPAPSPATSPPVTAAATMATLVNINTATREELETLWNIGPKTAQKIIDWRALHGPFRRIQDIDAVPGIGPVTIQRNLSRMCVTSPSNLPR